MREFAFLTMLGLSLAIVPARAQAGDQTVNGRIEEWIRMVALMDVVCEGVVEVATPAIAPAGVSPNRLCGGSTSEIAGKNLRLTVDSVPVGSIPSRTFDVRVPAPVGSAPGTRLIFWGNRTCTDEWRPWGTSTMVHDDGTIVLFSESLNGQPIEGRIAAEEFLARVRREAAPRRRPWEGFRALVPVRVTYSSWDKERRTLTYECVAIADSNRKITAIFHPSEWGWREMARGDTLALPLAKPNQKSVTYPTSSAWAEVRLGYVPALGVSFEDLQTAFDRSSGRYSLRPVRDR